MRADFYGRKSSKDDGRSIDGQEADYQQDCVEQDLLPGRRFADPDRSASRYARRRREDYDDLLHHIESGGCQLLWLWEASRGSRKLGEWVTLIDLLREQRIHVRIFVHGRTYDPTNAHDYRTLAYEGVESSHESEKISVRARRGKRMAAMSGRPVGRVGFGFRRIYDPETGKLDTQVPHPDQAPIVREIIKRISRGDASEAIARDLNRRGVSVPAQKPDKPRMLWSGAQVRQIAVKPSYAGMRVHQGRILGDANWAPLVDPDLWLAAHARLTVPGRRPPSGPGLAHWLAGAVTCGLCGGVLRSAKRSTGRDAYACGDCHRVSASARLLEPAVRRLILARWRRADFGRLLIPRRDDAALRAAEMEEAALRAQIGDAYAKAALPVGKGGISAGALASIEAGLLPRVEAAAERARRLSLPPAMADLVGVDVEACWDDLSPSTRRDVVRFLAHLVLDPGPRNGLRVLDRSRLARSRWVGDSRTWGEIQASTGT
jgi:site-specific DNA recombinase